MVAVDAVVLRVRERVLEVLFVRRKNAPYKGAWALPGGFIEMKESLEASARRELREETGLKNISYLTQLYAYGDPGRDPRGRVVTVAFIGIVPAEDSDVKGADDAAEAAWFPVEQTPARLAFDHATILGDALRRLTAAGRSSGILFAFLPGVFAEAELHDVLEAVYGVPLAPKDYVRPFVEMGIVRRQRGGKKYRFVGEGLGRWP